VQFLGRQAESGRKKTAAQGPQQQEPAARSGKGSAARRQYLSSSGHSTTAPDRHWGSGPGAAVLLAEGPGIVNLKPCSRRQAHKKTKMFSGRKAAGENGASCRIWASRPIQYL
jgi:hypothetical protein